MATLARGCAAELAQNVADVVLHGALRQGQAAGDRRIAEPCGHQGGDLALAAGELRLRSRGCGPSWVSLGHEGAHPESLGDPERLLGVLWPDARLQAVGLAELGVGQGQMRQACRPRSCATR